MPQILIIEDDPTAARLLARELRDAPEGFEVLTATSADAGLAVLADRPIDCVVLDYMLPDSRELNCLRAIRLAQPELPVILNTAAGSPSLEEQVRRLGARYVEKDHQYLLQLTQIVRQAISERELERANARIARGIFVGRREELVRLHAVVGETAGGQGATVLLAGEPGIGKSSLAMQAARDAHARGLLTLCGRCYEGGAPAYQPWKQIQRHLAEGGAGLGVENEATPLAPDLSAPAALEADDALFGLFDDASAWFRRAASRQPLVLLLEDLQWADDRSIGLLSFMAREVAETRVLLLGTYRDGELPLEHPLRRALPDLRRERLVEMRLRGLSEAEVGELVAAIAQREVPENFVHALHRRSEGNPFFVQEILRYLADEGIVFHQAGQWTSELDADEMPIPESVRAVINRRMEHLPPAARDVLAAAARIGRELTRESLLRVLDLPAERVGEGIRAALRARVLSERGTLYRFSHSLIYETLRDELCRAAGAPGAAGSGDPAGRQQQSVFRLDGRIWTIRHDGVTVRLPHINGLRYLAYLIHHPGRYVEALELPRVAQGLAPAAESRALAQESIDPMYDRQAAREIADALADLDGEIEIATDLDDLGRLERARERRASLQEYLRAGRGLRGRLRRMTDQSERARLNVTKCIRRAIRLLGETHPVLADHLGASVKTGRVCIYAPLPGQQIAWTG